MKLAHILASSALALSALVPQSAPSQSFSDLAPDVIAAVQKCASDNLYHFKTSACPDPGIKPPIPTTDFPIALGLRPASIPPSAAPDTKGAFRVICNEVQLTRDDAVVFPGKPGASHGHAVSGRTMDAFSTYENGRASGGSSCNNIAAYDNNPAEANFALNRTQYWSPWLEDGKGNAVLSDYNSFYYKREPSSSADCLNKTKFPGGCASIPFDLKFIAGNHPDNPAAYLDSHPVDYLCSYGNGSNPVNYKLDLRGALECAKAKSAAGLKGQMIARQVTPDCWDGKRTDSTDHRSHVDYEHRNSTTGLVYCDAAHPVHIPAFQYSAAYTVLATDDVSTWRWSCDPMAPTLKAGWCFHVDYGGMRWDPVVFAAIMANCIDKLLNCSGGVIGDGTALKGGDVPRYLINGKYVSSWTNPNRIVPIPPMPGM
jgi:hypothetical protein